MKLKEYFETSYGNKKYHNKSWLTEEYKGNTPLISSKGKNRGVYGYFNIEPEYENIITVPSTGTICYAIYQKNKCAVDDNTLVLKPKMNFSEREMIFYSLVIRKYKKCFMYGRQVTPKKADEFDIPSRDEIPSWIYEMEIPTYDDIAESKTQEKIELPQINEWKSFTYDEIFNIKKGNGISLTEAKKNPGNNAYVTSTCENNGVAVYTSAEPTEKANTITVNTDGSIGYAFYHTKPYLVNCHVAIYDLKERELNSAIAMFLITLIQKEQYKYNFGRAWGVTRMKKSIIKLPVTAEGKPDYDLMERYINSLPYSKYI